ncbi:hypothetical protein D3C73_958380 [compost metagenome]
MIIIIDIAANITPKNPHTDSAAIFSLILSCETASGLTLLSINNKITFCKVTWNPFIIKCITTDANILFVILTKYAKTIPKTAAYRNCCAFKWNTPNNNPVTIDATHLFLKSYPDKTIPLSVTSSVIAGITAINKSNIGYGVSIIDPIKAPTSFEKKKPDISENNITTGCIANAKIIIQNIFLKLIGFNLKVFLTDDFVTSIYIAAGTKNNIT